MSTSVAFDGDAVLSRFSHAMAVRSTIDASSTIRVLLVDTHRVVLEGLAAVLMCTPGLRVVGLTDNATTALEMFDQRSPDVCVVELRMTPMDGVTLTALMKARRANARVILLAAHETVEEVYRGVRAGAASFLLKSIDSETLIQTINIVHGGQLAITPNVAAKLAEHTLLEMLTARQIEVLHWVAQGNSNMEIAARLQISEGTVKAHVKAILQKLSARDRTHAITVAFRRGLIQS